MVRLPDIPLQNWLQDQQDRFKEATDGLMPALDFQLGARDLESQIPPDFDAPGGMDQWREAEKKQIEEQSRQAQQQADERRQQEIQAQAQAYQQQQQQADQARQDAVMQQIQRRGILTPDQAFAGLEAPPDNTSSAVLGAAPPPASPVDQFNDHANGLMYDTFGQPSDQSASDNPSSTGLLDRLGSAVSSGLSTARDALGSALSYVPDPNDPNIDPANPNVPTHSLGETLQQAADLPGALVGQFGSNQSRMQDIEQQARTETPDQTPRSILTGDLPDAYRQAHPDEAAEHDRLQQEQMVAVGGMSGTMGGGSMADDAINAIKALRATGMEEEAMNAAKGLAQKTPMTLDEILSRVGSPGAATAAAPLAQEEPAPDNYWEPTREERAANEANDAQILANPPEHSAYLAEDARNPETATSSTPSDPLLDPEIAPTAGTDVRTVDPVRADMSDVKPGISPEEAYQQKLPGFEDVPEAPSPPTRENIRGFGEVPQEPLPGEDAIRSINQDVASERKPFTFAERNQMVADLVQADPNAVGPVLDRALGADPKKTAVEQSLLRENVATWGDAFDRAFQDLRDTRQQIVDHVQAHGKESVPDELLQEATHRQTQLALVTNELRQAIKGQSLSASAYSAGLNAQRGGRLGAFGLSVAERVQGIGESAGRAAKALQKVVRDPASRLDQGALDALRELGNKLSDRTIKTVSESGATDAEIGRFGTARGREHFVKGGAGGSGPPSTAPTAPGGAAPREETLAEALGRLKREQGRLEDSGMAQDNPDLVGIQTSITDVLDQMHEEAIKLAESRINRGGKSTPPPTAAEAERMINEAVGRRVQSKINRQALDDARGFTAGRDMARLNKATQDAITRALEKHTRDTERLQKSIDAQVQRRVDGMLAQERRANVRQEVRTMAQEAQVWANRIRKMPDQRPALQEELDAVLGRMSEHSNVGERVAADLRERLGVNLQEDTYKRAFREEKQASDALTASRLRGVQAQIHEVLANPNAPDRATRISQLYQDLADINAVGIEKAQNMRRQAFIAGVDKSGLAARDSTGANKDILVDMLMGMDPKDPQSMRAALNTMIRPSIWKVWREMSFINMLSNPNTHETNVLSTTANAMLKLLVRNPLEFIFSGGRSSGVGAALEGTLGRRAWQEGSSLAGQTIWSGTNPDRFNAALASGHIEHTGQEMLPQVLGKARLGWVGTAYHLISTRPLEAMDAMMGHMVYAGEYARQAQQFVDAEIRAGKDLSYMRTPGSTRSTGDQAFQYILDNPWDFPEIQKKAGTIQDYVLYRTRGKGRMEVALRQFVGQKEYSPEASFSDKLAAWAIDFVMPFYNVPMNFAKQGIGNVVAPVMNTAKGVGAIARGDRMAAGENFAKAVQGGAIMAAATWMMSGDNLTAGGPADSGDRKVWALDHSPYSFRVPGTNNWISYEGSPLAIPFATVAGAAENLQFQQKADPTMTPEAKAASLASGGVQGAIQGLMSQTFIQAAERNFQILTGQLPGANDLSQALAGNASRYLSPVPFGMVTFLAQMTDATERDPGRAKTLDDIPQNVQDRLRSRIPMLRNELPARINAYGEPVPNERSGPMAFASIYRGPGTRPNDPITQQLERGSVGIPDAPTEITIGRGKIPLTIREQQQFSQVYGQEYRKLLEQHGAGSREMAVKDLEYMRTMARQRASDITERNIGADEVRRRWHVAPPELVAP